MDILKYCLILLFCSVICIVICRRLNLPAIIGYLSVGILVGPGGLGWLNSIEELHYLAEFGIVFLMFTLGLEFSIPKLFAAKRQLMGVGSLQVSICTALGAYICWMLGLNLIQSIIVGGGLALSSTAVVVKQVNEQKEQYSPHGSMSINILLFQDLAAVLFLIFIPAVGGDSGDPLHITFMTTLMKGILSSIGMALAGMWILRPLFHEVAKAKSNELFMMATLLVALGAATFTYKIGLSMALGAFLAGLMLGETEFRHQIELDIKPFRDVLLGLFFVVIGAYLELSAISTIWAEVLFILLCLLVAKGIVIMLIVKVFGNENVRTAFRTGLILAHGGEFGFVILAEAIDYNLLPKEHRPAVFAAVVISVMIAPLMIRANKKICRLFFTKNKELAELKEYPSHDLSSQAKSLNQHVILCGFGRVGQILSRFLDQENIPWIALDMDPMRLSKSAMAGENSFYGDATNPATLSAAGLSKARMLVLTLSNEKTAIEVVNHVRAMRLDIPVFVRTKDDSNLESFQDAGATEVVPESLEGSIMLASHLLLTLGVPANKIIGRIRNIHTDRYQILRAMYRGKDDEGNLEDLSEYRRSLHSLYVSEGCRIIGKTIESLLPAGCSYGIQALKRSDEKISEPGLSTIIENGDVIVAYATPEEAVIIEEKILNGVD